MPIRHQINIFVLFLTVLLVASLVQAHADDGSELASTPDVNADEVSYRDALADHYDIRADALEPLADLPAEDLAVALLVARQSRATPAAVAEARRDGRPWIEVAARFGLGPEAFYTPLPRESRRAPAALEPFLQSPRSDWKDLRLGDAELRSLANLRFLTAMAPDRADRIVGLSQDGTDFVTILALVEGADRPVGSQC